MHTHARSDEGPGHPPPANSPHVLGYLIGAVFFILAAWFVWGPDTLDLPASEARAVSVAAPTTQPRRQILGDPPVIHLDGFDRDCRDCHRLFPPWTNAPAYLLQHKHIVLDHGINDRCLNCHYQADRNMLVLHGGEPISFTDVVRLCAKCHGPTYRDWTHGIHGRSDGYWDLERGERRRLKCTHCHDPHNPRVPAMDPVVPLPRPKTLRMDPHATVAHSEADHPDDPLRIHPAAAQEEPH